MYDKKHFPKGIWTDKDYKRHKIRDPKEMSLKHLWNIMLFLTYNIPYCKRSKSFWRAKREEILKEIDKRAKVGYAIAEATFYSTVECL